MDLALPYFQAKDSDDEEEVVHVDRDHFMDEFFEQVESPVFLARNLIPSELLLPCAPPLSCTLLGLMVWPVASFLLPSPGPPTWVRCH